MLIHSKGISRVLEEARVNQDSTRIRIRERDLEAGLHHLTLFDEELTPVAERLFFIYPDRSDQLAISLDKLSYEDREKVELKVNNLMKDKSDLSELSLAVYQYNEELDKLSIDPLVYFHLQSELGRPIADPAYFFKSSSLSRKART